MGTGLCSEQGRRPALHPSGAQTSSPHPSGNSQQQTVCLRGSGASGCSRGCSRRQTPRQPEETFWPPGRCCCGPSRRSGQRLAGGTYGPVRGPSTEAALAGGGLRVGVQQDEPTSHFACLPPTSKLVSEGAFALFTGPHDNFSGKKIKDVSAKVINAFLLLFQTFSYPKFSDQHFWWKSQGLLSQKRTNGDPCSSCPTPHLPGDRPHQPKASALSPGRRPETRTCSKQGSWLAGTVPGVRGVEPCKDTWPRPVRRTGPVNRTPILKFFSTDAFSELQSVKDKYCFRKD